MKIKIIHDIIHTVCDLILPHVYGNPTSKQQLDMQNKNKTPIYIESDVKTGDAALLGAMACGV